MMKLKFAAAILAVVFLGPTLHPTRVIAQAKSSSAPASQPSSAPSSQTDEPKVKIPNPTNSELEEPDENEPYKQSANVKMIGGWMHMSASRSAQIFELLNFIVLAGLIGWALLRALPKLFRNRAANIQKQIVDARTATEQANARLVEVEQKLSRLDSDIAALQATAERDIADEQGRIHAALEAEKQRIITASEQEIAAATSLAQRQIKQFAAGLAIEQAAQKIFISAETERLMVEEFAASLGESGKGGTN